MTFAIDLISDLHIETWPDFDWSGQATSPYCIVAGDVCRDRQLLIDTLTHLGQCYPGGVFYIDGNDEHRYFLDNLGESYQDLEQQISQIPNVVYLQDNIVIVNGVAIVATNGWWNYEFDSSIDHDQTIEWYTDKTPTTKTIATEISTMSYHDAAYLIRTVNKLQTHKEVGAIIMVSHTLPAPLLIDHDTDLVDTWRFNTMGNKHLTQVLNEDTENKIRLWCFGHYHKGIDRFQDGIRWVNNCRGRGDTDWHQRAYYPKRLVVEL